MIKRMKRYIILSLVISLFSVANIRGQIKSDISHAEALKIVFAAKKMADDNGILVNIAVVDAGANLKAFVRMDESYLGSIDISIRKAKTARYFNISTKDLGSMVQPGGDIYNIEHSNGGLITFPGGVPIKNLNGKVIGAIGISGGTIEQDHNIAAHAIESITK